MNGGPVTRWRAEPSPQIRCDRIHGDGSGTLDERARRLSHEEMAVAELLRSEGHDVRSLKESRGAGRTPDLAVCGLAVEVKSWDPLGDGRDRAPTAKSVVNKLLKADGQAATVVLNARGSGLARSAAVAGMAEYASRARDGNIATVRVLGDGFDLGWTRERVRRPTPRHDRTALTTPGRALEKPGPALAL